MRKSDVVNITGGVSTEDGRTLYGLDAEVYNKMKDKEDPEWERKIGEWIEDLIGHAIEDTSDLWKSLKSGVILCELMNKIKPGIIKTYNNKPNLHILMEKENINLYLDGCRKLGMKDMDLFTTSDLHSRRSMTSVLQNLSCLSKFTSRFTKVERSISLPAVISPPPKKWKLEYRNKPIYSEEIKGDIESTLKETQLKLQVLLSKIEKLENSNSSLKTDLNIAREKIRTLTKVDTRYGILQKLISPAYFIWHSLKWLVNESKKSLYPLFGVVFVALVVVVWKLWSRYGDYIKKALKFLRTVNVI